MICPVCLHEIEYCDVCPFCKTNIALAKKLIEMSNAFYNRALDCVQKNNLSMSIKDLNKSLILFKKNINARNLLGLIYFRIGKIADALKHWVISNAIKKNDLAEKYILMAQENPKILAMYNGAIKFYNSGLEYIKQHNDDMGVINLKKSLELNPDFIDAMNLLALCYIYQEKNFEAKKILDRVLEIDKSNLLAKKYYEMLDFDSCEQKQKYKKCNRNKNFFIKIFDLSRIAIFFSGMILAIIIIYALIYPTQINEKNKSVKNLESELATIQESYNNLSETLPKLKKENDDLLKKNIDLEKEILISKNEKLISQAENLYKKNKFIEAAEIISQINFDGDKNLPDGSLDLKNKIYNKASRIYYLQALNLYRNKNYDQAKEIFEKASRFDTGEFGDKINFYLKEIELGDR